MYTVRRRFAEQEGSAVAAMTMTRGNSGAEAYPVRRSDDARDWAVLAVAALHWAAVASLAVASVGAGLTVWLG